MKRRHLAILWAAFVAIAVFGAVFYGNSAPHSGMQPPSNGDTIVIKPRLGDRVFVASVLESVFGPSEEARLIAERPEIFGGFCDPYSLVRVAPGPNGFAGGTADCGEQGSYQPTEQNPPSVVRQGYLIRACESLVARPQALNYAIAQLPGTEVNRASLIAAFQLFFPEREPSGEVMESLAKIPGADTSARWREVFKVLCSDPAWQAI